MNRELLRGEKVYLRRLEHGDLVHTWEWLHRPDVYHKIGVQVPFSHAQQERWFERLQQTGNKVVFAICRADNDEHIGNVSLDNIDLRHRNARLSIFIASDAHRGGGLGTEALQLLIGYAFEFLNLHRLWCKTNVDDERVLHFYQRLGFVQEGTLRQHEFQRGGYVDKALWGIVRTSDSSS